MTRPTTPAAAQTSVAAQMRETAARVADQYAKDCGPSYGNGYPAAEARNIAAAIRGTPLPPDPHAAQIAALTEAEAALTSSVFTWDKSGSPTHHRSIMLDADKVESALATIRKALTP